MLFKRVLTQYGQSLTGRNISPQNDVTYCALQHLTGDVSDLMITRRFIVDAMKEAKPFFLDHNAADYLDILGDTMVDQAGGPDLSDRDFMKEIKLPEHVVWVEYDAKALAYAKRERGAREQTPIDEIDDLGLRAVLFDNRDPDQLICFNFKIHTGGGIIDPLYTAVINKNRQGYPIDNTYQVFPTPHMARYYSLASDGGTLPKEMLDGSVDGMIHLYRMSFCLFASLNDRRDDLTIIRDEMFSDQELKNARKFSKDHILGAGKSHMTIRLDEPGLRYMKQMRDDETDRRLIAAGRTAPVRHEVREHERRYKSGKIVAVKAYVRGSILDNRPTRVTASKQNDVQEIEDDGPSF